MLTSQVEKWEEPHIVALVELDMHKIRVRVLVSREAIRERMRELECNLEPLGELQGVKCGSDSRKQLDGRPRQSLENRFAEGE